MQALLQPNVLVDEQLEEATCCTILAGTIPHVVVVVVAQVSRTDIGENEPKNESPGRVVVICKAVGALQYACPIAKTAWVIEERENPRTVVPAI